MRSMKPPPGTAMSRWEVERRFGLALSDCPFCGGAPCLFLSRIPHVTCGACGADGPRHDSDGSQDLERRQYVACQAWNARHQPQQ